MASCCILLLFLGRCCSCRFFCSCPWVDVGLLVIFVVTTASCYLPSKCPAQLAFSSRLPAPWIAKWTIDSRLSSCAGLYEHNSVWRWPMPVYRDNQWRSWRGKFFFFVSVLIEFLRLCNRAAWTTRHLVTRDVATTRQSAGDLVRWVIQRWRNYLLHHSRDDRVQGRWNCGPCLMFAISLQGPTWDGRSGVHVHMTNTRITDPEIIERR